MLRSVDMLRRIVPCLGLALLLAPSPGRAANGNKPRTPVVWSAADCATVVDRSQQPIVHFEYTVPNEETYTLTPDEVSDSRRHQFFAFRKLDYTAAASADGLPIWITQDDIDRAAMVDPMVQTAIMNGIDPATILDGGTRFDPSDWVRITPDDARVPITFDQAAMGVDWDVSAVEPGGWTIWGYTWEPTRNLWQVREGFVKVIASAAEADAAGPVVALVKETASIAAGQPHTVAGCADVPAGSTLTLEWGAVEGTLEPDWCSVIDEEPIDSGPLALDLVVPSAAAEGSALVKLRATVTDPDGNEYVAYSFGVYTATPSPDGKTVTKECHPKHDRGGGCSIAGGDPHDVAGRIGTAVLAVFVVVGLRRRR
jgi:hypothetical protein